MGIAINRLGKLGRWEDVLRQIEDGDFAMMGIFGEEIHDALVPSSLFHQIIQYQDPSVGLSEPLIQVGCCTYPGGMLWGSL